jgi:hypothetical protein
MALVNRAVLKQGSTITLKNTVKDKLALREIADVIQGTPSNGDVVVYNSSLDKYEVKPIDVGLFTISNLDGGTF